jgi:hypothetical protein
MAKAKLRVHWLTLPPSSCLGEAEDAGGSDQQAEEDHCMLDRESMMRITYISIMASEGTTTRPHVHGVEPSFRSKF